MSAQPPKAKAAPGDKKIVLDDPLKREKEWSITPGVNLETLLWITLLGLPGMILFLIYSKLNEF